MARSRRRDDDDDDDDTPRKKSRHRDDDDDEDEDDEDEDDAPRRKKSRRRDDDDDDDDRPRKRRTLKRSKKSAGGGPLLLVLGLVGGFVLLAGCGVAAFFLFFNETPKSAFEDVRNCVLKSNYGGFYDRLDADSQRLIDSYMFVQAAGNPLLRQHAGKKGRDLFIAICEENERRGERDDSVVKKYRTATVQSVTEAGTTATLTVRTGDGRTEQLVMKKENGKWKLSLAPTAGPSFR